MKATPKQYAMGLLLAVRGKKDDDVRVIADAFAKLLVQNNNTSKADLIFEVFSLLWDKEHGIVESRITTARKLDADTTDRLKVFLSRLTGAREIKMEEKIDSSALGGAIIRYGDTVMDYSVKTKISDLNSAIKQ